MDDRGRAGFVLLEVLVAAAVAVVLIVLLIRMGSDRRVGLADLVAASRTTDVARAVLAEASRRDALVVGERSGRTGNDDWRVEVTATDCVRPAKPPPNTLATDACPRGGWRLHRIRVDVTDSRRRRTSLETWRLGRVGG